MASVSMLFLSLVIGSFVYLVKRIWDYLFWIPPVPKLQNIWWGPGECTDDGDDIRPFQIKISDDVSSKCTR